MFINAKPRYVSNSFDTFVFNQRAESLYPRLIEMTNSDVNAWSVYRPAASMTDTWNDSLDNFGGNDNFLVQPLYGGHFQNSAPVSQNQVTDLSKMLYTAMPGGFNQHDSKSVAYQNSIPNMNCYEQLSPMLGRDYAQLSLDRGRGSFVEFSNAGHALKDFRYNPSTDSNTNSFSSATSLCISAPLYSDEISNFGQSLNISRPSPDEVFSCYSPKAKPVSSHVPVASSSSSGDIQQEEVNWWLGNTKDVETDNQIPYNLDMSSDGVPKYQAVQQSAQYSGPWNMTSTPTKDWTATLSEPKPISPEALTLNISSGSSSQASMGLPMSNTASSTADIASDVRYLDGMTRRTQTAVYRPRHSLSNEGPSIQKPLPDSSDVSPSRNLRKRRVKAVETESQARRSSPPTKTAPKTLPQVQRPTQRSANSASQRKSLPESPTPVSSQWGSSTVMVQAGHIRSAKDDFLIKSKMAGMSYKEIRKQGKFAEAESTLRGRYRTLTKHKAARVRRPEWSDEDIRLLKKAVRKLSVGDPAKGKIPWKKVAEYIADNGGSYHFGNATCHKRWEELQASS